jgi:ribosomal protein S18 acetylase RimI-like enzyme
MHFARVSADAAASQVDAVRRLVREYASLPHVVGRWTTIDEDIAQLPAPFVAPHGALLLALDADEPVACGAVRLLDDTTAEVKRMYVRPAARGLGIGEALLRALLTQAQRLGAVRVRLDTAPELRPAIALYTKLGFTRIERYLPEQLPDAVCFERAVVVHCCLECGAEYQDAGDSCAARFDALLALDHSRQEPWGSRHGQAFAAFALQHPVRHASSLDSAWAALYRVVVQGAAPAEVFASIVRARGGLPATWGIPPRPAAPAMAPTVTIADLGAFTADRYPAQLDEWCRSALTMWGHS